MSVIDFILGRRLATFEEEEHKVGVLEGVPMLGLDALASSAYGPEAALTILIPLGAVGLVYLLPLVGVILAILVILYFSYRQTIAAYPTGGGSYTVAKENLGERFGLLAAAALLLDYVLNVAVGISAGIAALVSAVPGLHPHTLTLCLVTLAIITVVNLRGIRESGTAWAVPTYLFVLSLGGVLVIGTAKALLGGGHPRPVVPPLPLHPMAEAGGVWLLMRAFASGCTAMTGVEAVSNGVQAFAEPATKRAQATLTTIVAVLGLLLLGIGFLCRAYGIGAALQDQPGYQSVISQITGAVTGRGAAYYVTIAAVLAVLCLSANTSFAGFPRLCHLIAEDGFLPHAFANKGRRLVYSHGIVILAAVSGALLALFGGITDRLIPLFAVGAFLAFTLSQLGMVFHWKREGGRHAKASLAINALGAAATACALAVIVVAKFVEGAWITIMLIPALLAIFYAVRRHYECVRQQLECPRPIRLGDMKPPLVVIPVIGWNTITEKAVRFAVRLCGDPIAVHVGCPGDDEKRLHEVWHACVREPLRQAGLPAPELVTLPSPYRHLTDPIIRYVRKLEKENPDRLIAVVVPELVESHWYEYLLHNQRAELLRASILLRGDPRTVVINVPWYLDGRPDEPEEEGEQ